MDPIGIILAVSGVAVSGLALCQLARTAYLRHKKRIGEFTAEGRDILSMKLVAIGVGLSMLSAFISPPG